MQSRVERDRAGLAMTVMLLLLFLNFFLRGPGEQRSCKYVSSATEVLRRGHESAGSLVFFSRCRNVRAVTENTTVGAS